MRIPTVSNANIVNAAETDGVIHANKREQAECAEDLPPSN